MEAVLDGFHNIVTMLLCYEAKTDLLGSPDSDEEGGTELEAEAPDCADHVVTNIDEAGPGPDEGLTHGPVGSADHHVNPGGEGQVSTIRWTSGTVWKRIEAWKCGSDIDFVLGLYRNIESGALIQIQAKDNHHVQA